MGTRILTVEDDERIRTSVRLALEDEGWTVEEAESGEDALNAFTREPADVVLIDIMLPGIDGFDVCRSIRRASDVPIVMVTARADTHDVVAGLEAGADDYLTKPFAYPELAARVRALLRRPRRATGPILTAGDIRLDPAAHTVWRGAIMVPLTPREHSLLEYLLRHQERVCRRDELLEHVWDANYDGLSNVVDVHIANLRRKLAVPGSDVPIDTIRGVGYQLTA